MQMVTVVMTIVVRPRANGMQSGSGLWSHSASARGLATNEVPGGESGPTRGAKTNISVQAGQSQALRVPLQFTVALALYQGAAAISAGTKHKNIFSQIVAHIFAGDRGHGYLVPVHVRAGLRWADAAWSSQESTVPQCCAHANCRL